MVGSVQNQLVYALFLGLNLYWLQLGAYLLKEGFDKRWFIASITMFNRVVIVALS